MHQVRHRFAAQLPNTSDNPHMVEVLKPRAFDLAWHCVRQFYDGAQPEVAAGGSCGAAVAMSKGVKVVHNACGRARGDEQRAIRANRDDSTVMQLRLRFIYQSRLFHRRRPPQRIRRVVDGG